jgi:2-isopropylmalate synthase
VRILFDAAATSAAVRVLISMEEESSGKTWDTVGCDRNLISASMNALVDGYEYACIQHSSACALCEEPEAGMKLQMEKA